MKKTLSILLILAMALSLSAAAFAEGAGTEKTVPVYRESMTGDETVTLRMVGDIPYMRIDDYYNRLIFTGAEKYPQQASPMTVTHSGSVYETTAYDGTKGIFDAEENSFACENLDVYSNPPYYALLLASERDPSAPFVSVSHTDYKGERKSVNVDFKKYGIDILGEGDDLWVPLAVLQGLFCSPYAYNVFYNGKAIYLSDGMQLLQAADAKDADGDYYAFGGTERSEEKIRFDYGSLCFYVDTCYGYPERSRLSESLAEVGLDGTLDRTIDGMNLPGVKKLLLSPDMKEYTCGLFLLLTALDDGGHTAFVDFGWVPEENLTAWPGIIAELGISRTDRTNYAGASSQGLSAAFETAMQNSFDRAEVLVYDNAKEQAVYLEQGDTAMFVFDHFYCNRAAWTAYEDGVLSEMPEDSMGSFMKALEMAKANPNIKNFVVNIAMNAGGESGIATTIAKLICGQAYRHQLDILTGQDETIWYDIDLDFDGDFDEEDGKVSYPFRFAVIEGARTYSAANYLANMAKDNGVCVLGERSGGGANSPQMTPESEGLWFQLSGRYKLMDKNNETVDFGVEPDYVLTEEKDGAYDYSRFFDFAEISRLIDEYYGNQSSELSDTAEDEADPASRYEQALALYYAEDYEAVLPLVEELTEEGIPEAMTMLGYLYGMGLGTEQNDEEMLKYYRMAAELGEPMAIFNLGVCYRDGLGVEQNYEEMLKYFERAAEMGNAEALYNLGYCYYMGDGLNQDYDRAFSLYQQAADQGLPPAMFALGDCYFLGNGVKKDTDTAVEWYHKALADGYEPDQTDFEHLKTCADDGNAEAQNELGKCYAMGIGVAQDDKEAVRYFRMAADQGLAKSQYNLGNDYLYGVGVEQDTEKAAEYLKAAAEQGLPQAQSQLGYMYENGFGVEADPEKAVEYYQAAADQGDAYAQNNLGNCYFYGRGVEKDIEKAVQYYQLAAEQGEPYALNNMGCCYSGGEGVEQDYGKAMQYFQAAAEQGNADAIYNLGYSYYFGEGVKQDADTALEYFRTAAELGNPNAMFVIGESYYEGKGSEKDPDQAAEWYLKALRAGYVPDEEDQKHLADLFAELYNLKLDFSAA